jgi:hypothetical protein
MATSSTWLERAGGVVGGASSLALSVTSAIRYQFPSEA